MDEKTADIFNNGNWLSEYTVYFSILWSRATGAKLITKLSLSNKMKYKNHWPKQQ